jgi:hypothetical protein
VLVFVDSYGLDLFKEKICLKGSGRVRECKSDLIIGPRLVVHQGDREKLLHYHQTLSPSFLATNTTNPIFVWPVQFPVMTTK